MEWVYYIQGYPLVLITTLIEGAAIPFPGAFLLAWSGFILGRDLADLALATGLGVSGYMVGAIIPYLLGRLGGRPVIEQAFRRFQLSTGKIDLAERWFNKYGLVVVAASRPFFLGNYVSFVAGMAHTRFIPFLLCTGLGIFPWVFVYLYLGMVFGRHWQKAVELVGQYSTVTFVVILSVVLIFIFRKRLLQLIR